MMITKIRFTAVTIAWTEGGILHLRIRASAENADTVDILAENAEYQE